MIWVVVSGALAVDRETSLDLAAQYVSHEWTMTEENASIDCAEDWESDYSPGNAYRGLPYDWGGYVTLDEYDEQLASGYGAGSHSWHGVLSCTTGVDCSGFLSQLWQTGHYGTSTFYQVTTDISVSEVKRADAFNDAGSHIVMFAYETDAGNPVFYEAAGSAEKTRLNSSSGWSYLDGYQPIRFDDITDGPSTGTVAEPREILAFPYEDFRWTAGAASDAIDSYSCAPGTDESGPEVLYWFEAETSGILHAVVSDDAGVDVDLHVMTGPDGASCVARDDTEVEVEVGPGEVWLSLDTYVGSQEFPGPYLLIATFTPTGDVTDTELPEDSGTDSADSEDPGDDSEDGTWTGIPGGRERQERKCGCTSVGVPLPSVALLAALFVRRRRARAP